jgi:tetratricopeptide (TPR) repeat protein
MWIAGLSAIVMAATASPARQSGSVGSTPATQNQANAGSIAAVKEALALEQQGKIQEAQVAWQKVIKAQPRNAQAFAHLGLLQARQEQYSAAIASYRKAQTLSIAEKHPIPQLDLDLGLALFKSGDFHEAGKCFEAELRKHPGDQRLTILLGMSHYGAREYAAAIPYLKTATAADQKNLPLRLDLAHCYLWTKQLDATMAVYKEILQINPDSAEADMIAGEALDQKGDNAGAVQQFRDAVKADPKVPNVHFGLAYLLWAQKRYDEAIPEFQAELANDPKNNQAMLYLGDTYVHQDQFEKAKPVLEEAARLQTKVPLTHLDLGIVYMETGNKELAIRELDKAIEMEPDNVNAHFRLAKLYQAMGKKDEAKVEFAKASSLNKKVDDSLYKRIADANARPEDKTSPQESAPNAPSAPNRK